MSVGAFVAVELPYANDYQRDCFDTAMEERQWTRFGQGFCAEIDDESSDTELVRLIEDIVEECASDAGIGEWSAVCVLTDVHAAMCIA